MAKENLTLSMEPELKEQASELFQALGMDLSTATRIFYRQALNCQGLPFSVQLKEPNEKTYTAIDEAVNNHNLEGPFENTNELIGALDA